MSQGTKHNKIQQLHLPAVTIFKSYNNYDIIQVNSLKDKKTLISYEHLTLELEVILNIQNK